LNIAVDAADAAIAPPMNSRRLNFSFFLSVIVLFIYGWSALTTSRNVFQPSDVLRISTMKVIV
jgi:hypothetical protein